MLKTENCPTAAVSYSTERMVLNQNRNIAFALEAAIGNMEGGYDYNCEMRVERGRKRVFFPFASYAPLLLAARIPEGDNSGLFVLIACCLFAFFLFGGRHSKQIKD